jgi:hypothetical protein
MTAFVRSTGFVSPDDGQELITQLEQFPSDLLTKAVGMEASIVLIPVTARNRCWTSPTTWPRR